MENENRVDAISGEDTSRIEFGVIMRQTAQLRFVFRLTEGKVLQQLWANVHGPETEWRDVPMVKEE
jgi:hypothetical protein